MLSPVPVEEIRINFSPMSSSRPSEVVVDVGSMWPGSVAVPVVEPLLAKLGDVVKLPGEVLAVVAQPTQPATSKSNTTARLMPVRRSRLDHGSPEYTSAECPVRVLNASTSEDAERWVPIGSYSGDLFAGPSTVRGGLAQRAYRSAVRSAPRWTSGPAR